MRSFAIGSAAVAASAGLVQAGATSASTLCQNTAQDIGGNWYCQAVNAITYSNFGSSGSYNRITNMDPTTGSCSSEPQAFSGSLAPLNEEVSLHFRGPLTLKQFAFYTPGASNNLIDKRDDAAAAIEDRRVHHIGIPNRVGNHGHAAAHAKMHEAREERQRRDDPCDPANKPMVTATIDGKVVSWVNDYFGPECAAKTAAPATSTANAVNKVVNAVASAITGVAGAASSAASAYVPSTTGDWVQAAYYNAESGQSQGITFLNNLGGGSVSGTWDTHFGNSLSYASSDGKSAASSSQILSDVTIDGEELVIMTDKSCNDGKCGYSRPGTVAYHGFDGAYKVFLFEFGMPDNGQSGWNENMPAIWMLNAQIPRTLQYGSADCSCWPTGCGEFDLFEVLTPGETRCKSTLHANVAGGDSNYFNRPTSGTIKAAVAMMDNMAHIKILDNSYNFTSSLTNTEVQQLASEGNIFDELANLASSLFTLS